MGHSFMRNNSLDKNVANPIAVVPIRTRQDSLKKRLTLRENLNKVTQIKEVSQQLEVSNIMINPQLNKLITQSRAFKNTGENTPQRTKQD